MERKAETMERGAVRSGISEFDEVVQELRLGDNVVWQVDSLEDYVRFAEPFARQSLADGRDLVYIRFAPHEPVVAPQAGLTIIEVDPGQGFDAFSA